MWSHLDRVDAAPFQRAMMMDVDQAAKAMRDEEMQAGIEDFIEGFNQPIYPRHADQWAADRHLVVIPARVVQGWPARCGVGPMSRPFIERRGLAGASAW